MPLGPQFTRLFDLTAREFGFLVSVYLLAAAVAALAAALLVDRFERRRALLTMYGLFTLATFACAAAPNFATLLAARAFAGAFGGVAGALVMTMVGDTVPEARRGRALGVVMSAFSLASVAGVPVGLFIAAQAGWRWTFVFVGVMSLGFAALGLRLLPAVTAHLAVRRADLLPALWSEVRDPNHLRAFVFMALMVFSGFTVIPYVSLYLVANVGVREQDLPQIYLAGGAATFLAARVIGRLADRFGKLRMYRVLAALSILPLLAMTHAPALPLAWVIVLSVAFFVLVSGRFIPAMALVTSGARPGSRGTFMSLTSAVQQLGSGAATMVAALIVQRLPDAQGGTILNYPWVGYLASVCALAAMWWAGSIQVRDAAPPSPSEGPRPP
jgi:predicted MFS family arabinose efflux permease